MIFNFTAAMICSLPILLIYGRALQTVDACHFYAVASLVPRLQVGEKESLVSTFAHAPNFTHFSCKSYIEGTCPCIVACGTSETTV